ncbi:unnamed protein product [Clavelina lepadiformis]|uniref:BED-type domain-containing protein n=1 Tax=Clavelina lepadiformis TaxID=159417 RepID=A0ABP0G0Q1_CLALP
MSTGRGRKKSSSVWEHFCKPDEKNSVVCRHCKAILSYCNSTGSLLKHLKKKHVFLNISGIEGSLSASANNNSRKQKIKSAIECRFSFAVASDDVPFPSLFDMATWLHPAYKEKYFKPHHATRVRLHLKSEMISDTTIAVIAPPHNPIPVGDSTTSSVSMMENLFNLGMEVQQSNQEDADDKGADIDTIITNEVSAYLKESSNKTDVLEYWNLKKKNSLCCTTFARNTFRCQHHLQHQKGASPAQG